MANTKQTGQKATAGKVNAKIRYEVFYPSDDTSREIKREQIVPILSRTYASAEALLSDWERELRENQNIGTRWIEKRLSPFSLLYMEIVGA